MISLYDLSWNEFYYAHCFCLIAAYLANIPWQLCKNKNCQRSLHFEFEPHWTESDLHEKKILEIQNSIIHFVNTAIIVVKYMCFVVKLFGLKPSSSYASQLYNCKFY